MRLDPSHITRHANLSADYMSLNRLDDAQAVLKRRRTAISIRCLLGASVTLW
jgi:hypothetical protein